VSGTFGDDLAFASAIARDAGAIVMERYERLEAIHHKSAKDVVTEADHLAEAALIAAIRARNPTDAVYAEESGADSDGATSGRGRTWILDPLDGTVNYANGIPFFCISVALVIDGRPAVGAVYDPTRDELFAASAETAATLNGRPIASGVKEGLADAVVSLGLSGDDVVGRTVAVRKAVRVTRSMGSSALSLAYVANGRFDAFAQETGQSAWDVAAAGLIAARGGAIVTDFAGADWFEIGRKGGTWGVIGAAPRVHPPLFELIGTRGDSPARGS
jgi:myo-inositol-1(or 4)-monophosphatase